MTNHYEAPEMGVILFTLNDSYFDVIASYGDNDTGGSGDEEEDNSNTR
ncbi:MAG: hypothetical protein LUH18_02720 [Oscillospiraceae bacterium]|nr:hypothetical protein [Oscillospiraceae bacterium]